MKNTNVSWDIARTKPHAAHGIESPEAFQWKDVNGIYYPVGNSENSLTEAIIKSRI
jgi:hypothetical protein